MRVLATALLLLAVTRPATAQLLRGRLIDVISDQPIAGGMLALVPVDGGESTVTITDAQGSWQLQAARPGAYYVSAKRIGYQPWVAGPIELAAGDDIASVFRLRPIPVLLDPVEVTAARVKRYLEFTGFFERQKSNFGHFMTPDDIAKRRATTITSLLTTVPGVRLVSMTGASAGPQFVQLRGSNLTYGGVCRPRVYVDGLVFARGDSRPVRLADEEATEVALDQELHQMDQALSLDDIGHPSTIAAIEIYRSASQVPVQFGGTSRETLCGVIVIWTKTGSMAVGQ